MHILGRWQAHQGNNYNPIFELRDDGRRLVGTASLTQDEGLRAGYAGAVSQALDGKFEDGKVKIRVVWPAKRDGSHAIGIYKGRLHHDRIEGECYDELVPNHPVYPWHAERA